MKYMIEITESNGATSPVDNIEAPAGYTAQQYIRDCEENADQDWCDMLHRAEAVMVIEAEE